MLKTSATNRSAYSIWQIKNYKYLQIKIIAESAYNHQGNFEYLKQLALESKKANADYFTVQMMNVNEFCTKEYSKYQLYKDTEFTETQ